MPPRYEVHSITGYSEKAEAKPTTTWWVADTLDCYHEQLLITSGTRPSRPPGRTTKVREIAERNCARLNAEDRADAA